MKPDTFTELIRRKLESIRPDVTERDWTRMQRSLRQAGLSGPSGAPVAGVGAVPSWLLAVAGIGTAVLLTITVWQRSEINTLREKLTQQTVTSAPGTAPTTLNEVDRTVAPAPQRDTVYISRYAPVEPVDHAQSSRESRLSKAHSISEMNTAATAQSTPENQPVITQNTSRPPITDTRDATSSQSDNARPGNTLPDNTSRSSPASDNTLPGNSLSEKAPLADQSRLAATKEAGKVGIRNSRTNTNTFDQQKSAQPGTTQPANPATVLAEDSGGPGRSTEATLASENATANQLATPEHKVYALATTRSLRTKPINWSARLTRRFPRPANNAAVASQPESPASQSKAKLATAFRIGVGSDLRANYWNTGIVAETVLGGRWVLSAGLVRSSNLLGSFVTDDDYEYRTRHNFRREFVPNFDPKREIYGIDARSIRYQIPVSLGYRIPVGKSLSILPSVGAYLDLSNDLQITFSYRTPPPRYGYETAVFQGKESSSLLNAYTAGAALEWQQKHWVVQGGLLYAQPLYSDMNGTAAPALGGRMRLLYQF